MPGVTIGKTLNHGFVGNYARTPDAIVVGRPNQDTTPIAFGAPVQAGTAQGVKNAAATLTAANFVGVATTEVNSNYNYLDQTQNGGYGANKAVNVLQRGSVNVRAVGTPSCGGTVYIALTTAGGGLGKFVAGTPTGTANTDYIELPTTVAQWGGDADSNGIAELVLLTRVHA